MCKFVWLHCFLSHYSQVIVMYTHTHSLCHPRKHPRHRINFHLTTIWSVIHSCMTWLFHVGRDSFISDMPHSYVTYIQVMPYLSASTIVKCLSNPYTRSVSPYIYVHIYEGEREKNSERETFLIMIKQTDDLRLLLKRHPIRWMGHVIHICVCVCLCATCVCAVDSCLHRRGEYVCTSDVCPNDVHHAYTHIHTHTHTYPLSHTRIHTHIHTNTHDMHQAPVHKKCWYMI